MVFRKNIEPTEKATDCLPEIVEPAYETVDQQERVRLAVALADTKPLVPPLTPGSPKTQPVKTLP